MGSQTKLTTALTDRILAYIVQFKQVHDGLSPSAFRIAQECHLAASAVKNALADLVKANRIKVMPEGIVVIGGFWSPPAAPPRPVDNLSPVAKAIAQLNPSLVGNQPKSLRWWGDMTGYGHPQIIRGFRELAAKGLASTVPYGKTRQRYVADLASLRTVI